MKSGKAEKLWKQGAGSVEPGAGERNRNEV
jgi:hypothetical protein